jgi:hypothetical protein
MTMNVAISIGLCKIPKIFVVVGRWSSLLWKLRFHKKSNSGRQTKSRSKVEKEKTQILQFFKNLRCASFFEIFNLKVLPEFNVVFFYQLAVWGLKEYCLTRIR